MRENRILKAKTGALIMAAIYMLCIGAYTRISAQASRVQKDMIIDQDTRSQPEETQSDISDINIPEASHEDEFAADSAESADDVIEYAQGDAIENKPSFVDTLEPCSHIEGSFCSLPDLPTNVKACTDYRCYNIKSTPHWRLQQRAWTDEWGLRRFGDDYIVGLGTYYSTDIGDRFEVVLDSGQTFTIILGDNKADRDTDETNRYRPCAYYTENDANVLEFIADFKKMPDWVYARGSIDCIDEFAGNIASLKYLGRDTSGDWDSYI